MSVAVEKSKRDALASKWRVAAKKLNGLAETMDAVEDDNDYGSTDIFCEAVDLAGTIVRDSFDVRQALPGVVVPFPSPVSKTGELEIDDNYAVSETEIRKQVRQAK